MQSKLAGIDRRKKVAAKKRNQTKGNKNQGAHARENSAAMFEAPAQGIDIAGAKFFEHMIEFLVNTAQETENSAESTSMGCGLFFAMPSGDLFFAAVMFINSMGEA